MKGVNGNGNVLLPPPVDDDGVRSQVDFRLNNLVASHLSNPDLKEIAEASTSSAAAAAIAAKAARATALDKAAAATKAIAAAKTALDLIASFPRDTHATAHLLPSNLRLGDLSRAIMPVSAEHCQIPISNDHTPGGQGAKQGIQATRKRGRPKSK